MQETLDQPEIRAIGITLRIAALSIFQCVIFVFSCDLIFEIYSGYVAPMSVIHGFESQMDWGTSLLAILCGVNSVGQVLTRGAWIKLTFLFLTSLTWIAFWANIATVVPNRFLLLSVAGLTSFAIGAFICERRFRFHSSILQQTDVEGVK